MRIAICDDEQIYLDEVNECCRRYFAEKNIECEIDTYQNGNELIDKAALYDIVLLDVDMPAISGIDIKKCISDRSKKARILFISSYPENMPEAFGERVIGFLVKPLVYKKFVEKMNQIIKLVQADDRFIIYETLNDNIKIRLKDIVYIQAERKYSRLYINDGRDIFIIKGIGECEKELGREFVKCHKSYLINLSHVRMIKDKVILKNGIELPLGRTMSDKVKETYNRYILEEGTIWIL